MKASASAPGKVILFGEHAVVYGIPAIAAATSDLRLRVDLESTPEIDGLSIRFHDIRNVDGSVLVHQLSKAEVSAFIAPIHSRGPLLPINPSTETLQPMKDAFSTINPHATQGSMATIYLLAHLLPELVHSRAGLQVDIQSFGLPIGAGLGSSAAFSVALAGAMLLLRQRLYSDVVHGPWGEGEGIACRPPVEVLGVLNGWSYASEVVIHGTPSGLDNYTSCYGGVVKYDKSTSKFESFPSLARPLHMLLTNTKVPRSTKVLVAGVRRLHDTFPLVMKPVLDAIGGVSSSFLKLIEDNSSMTDQQYFDSVGQLITMNQALLTTIGVSHPSLQVICDESSKLSFPSKLTGAGGGGCALTLLAVGAQVKGGSLEAALHTQAITQLKAKLRGHGYDVFESALAGSGVLWHL